RVREPLEDLERASLLIASRRRARKVGSKPIERELIPETRPELGGEVPERLIVRVVERRPDARPRIGSLRARAPLEREEHRLESFALRRVVEGGKLREHALEAGAPLRRVPADVVGEDGNPGRAR